MEEFVRSAISWVAGINWPGIYGIMRAIFIFLNIVLIIAFFAVLPKAWEYRPKFYLHPESKKKKKIEKNPELVKNWQRIMERAMSNPPQTLVWAIIEADKFTDDVLKKMGFQGEHMADRLEKLNNWDLKSLDGLWRAHRIRNELVHQPDFNISHADAHSILGLYESFLKELEII